jgi:hypothetical protein
MADDLSSLRRMAKHKATHHTTPPPVGDALLSFFKKSVERRQPKLDLVSRVWQQLVPPFLLEHTCLEAYTRGTLTVLVDSSSHLFELRQLLLSGLEKQMAIACKSAGLRKVTLRRGQWYDPKTGAPLFG